MNAITEIDPTTSHDASDLGNGLRRLHLRSIRAAGNGLAVAVPRYFVLYRRSDAGDCLVLRLLHGASDLPSWLQSGD